MLTFFGKALRKFRIDRGLLLKDMANALGFTAAFLSAIEMGRKKIPENLLGKLKNIYSLDDETVQQFRSAAEKSAEEVVMRVKGLSEQDQDLVMCFAKKFYSFSEIKKQGILKFLQEDE